MGLGWGKGYLPGQPWGSSLATGTKGVPPLQGGGLPGEVSLPSIEDRNESRDQFWPKQWSSPLGKICLIIAVSIKSFATTKGVMNMKIIIR